MNVIGSMIFESKVEEIKIKVKVKTKGRSRSLGRSLGWCRIEMF